MHGESYHIKVGGKGHKSEGKRPYFVWVDNQLVEVLIEPLVEVLPSEEGKISPNVGGQSKRPKPKEQGDVTAPMPGTVIRLKVKVGDTVKAGDTVLIIEAMKMENEVHTPVSGEVKEIYVKEGDSVNPDEALVIVGKGRIVVHSSQCIDACSEPGMAPGDRDSTLAASSECLCGYNAESYGRTALLYKK